MKLWQGLGYYSRARNLQRAARQIMEEHGGIFPSTYEEIRALSGVGDYTAGAISSIAFGLPVPAVDGNVLRVAARVTGDEGDIAAPATKKRVTAALAEIIPLDAPGDFNQAMMELGATVCLPNGAPLCDLCPARAFCTARLSRPDRPAAGEGGQEGPEGGGAHRLSHLPRKPGGPAAQAGTGASGRAVGVPQRALSRRGRPGPLGHCSRLPPERRDGEAYLHPHRVAHVRPGGGGGLPRAAGGVGLGGPGCPGPGIRRPQRLPALSRGGGGEAGTFLTGGGNAMICDLCPRRCGALRTEERGLGRCRMPELPVLARAALHRWEEPPISGTRGSGTIFFSGCSLGCVFCQNEEISHRDFGKAVTLERLARICGELVDQGAHNLNFVNPTHYAHVVGRLLEEHPQPVPVVWNSGGYDRVDTLRALEGKIQIYLPDLKYLDSDAAGRYSGASDYPQTAQAAIREMVRQTGPCAFDGDGLLTRGVVIRHLILPGQVSQAKAVMDWVAAEFGPGTVLFSLMSQYTPWGRSAEFPEIHRRLRAGEMRAAAEYMANLGLEGFTQERTSAQREYTPPFDLTGVAGEGGAL